MTWEYRSTFEEEPSLKCVLDRFAQEMPQAVARVGGVDKIRMWPMVSFNATEGRLWRYLVALIPVEISERFQERKYDRCLPGQITLVALANRYLMELQNGNSGNCVFWTLHEGVLYLLVYFEGRLCHWSEESGLDWEESVCSTWTKNRIARFQKFLEQDSLFSRGEHFDVVELRVDSTGFSLGLFLEGSRDPFFRRMKLNEIPGGERKPVVAVLKVFLPLVILPVLPLLLEIDFDQRDLDEILPEIPDATPVELDLPPPMDSVRELRMPKSPKCVLPQINLRGIVGGKLAIVEIAGQMKNLVIGDSLQELPDGKMKSYVVQNVVRDRLILKCGNKIVEVTPP